MGLPITNAGEREIRGMSMVIGTLLAAILAYHFFGWVGTTGVLSAFFIWRAI